MNQKEIFLSGEGNAWFQRNKDASLCDDEVIKAIQYIELTNPKRILEIGCSDGRRLEIIKSYFKNAECFGIDPSEEAINIGNNRLDLKLTVGTADNLQFESGYFDLILFGFSLYLCDRKDLFKIAYEADRCLSNNGYLIIKDFCTPFPYKNKYIHHNGISSYKMDYSKMFIWNPVYTEIFKIISSHNGFEHRNIPDERINITILNKNESYSYPHDIKWN